MKKTKTYQPKKLFSGVVIGKEGDYVALPNTFKEFRIEVLFNGESMIIENWNRAEAYRRFPDKWGRGMYTLAYFKWAPEIKAGDAIKGLAAMPEDMKEELRRKLHVK